MQDNSCTDSFRISAIGVHATSLDVATNTARARLRQYGARRKLLPALPHTYLELALLVGDDGTPHFLAMAEGFIQHLAARKFRPLTKSSFQTDSTQAKDFFRQAVDRFNAMSGVAFA